MKPRYFPSRAAWRQWLSRHHDTVSEVWLLYYKKGAGKTGVSYNDSVEEALCFGWIDGLVKKIDDTRYARRFTPRKDNSVWSPSNKQRVARLTRAGLMTEAGLAKVRAARKSGWWDRQFEPPPLDTDMSPEFARALKRNRRAREHFERLAPSQRQRFIIWINMAKRPETKKKRIIDSIAALASGETLGLK